MMSAALESPARSTVARGYLYAGLVVLLWAGFSLSGRYASLVPGPRLTPWDLAALRFAVTLPVGALAYLAGPARGLSWRRTVVVALVAGLCFPLPAYLGFTLAPVAHSAVILSGTLPFLVAIGLALTGDGRFGRVQVQSLLVLLLGIALLGDAAYVQGHRPGAWRGDLLFLAAAIAWAAFTVMARRWSLTPWQVVGTCGLWGGLIYLPIWALALPSRLGEVPAGAILFQMVMQGVLVSIVSVLLYTRALASIGATRVSLVTALVPGVAGLLAMPLLGEEVGLLDLAGLALVSAAVALGVRRG